MKNINVAFFIGIFLVGCLVVSRPESALAAGEVTTDQANILGEIVTQFYAKTNSWASVLTGAALSLFRVLLVLDLALLGVKMVLKKATVDETAAEAVKLLFYAGVMLAILKNYKEWSLMVIKGFKSLGNSLGYSPSLVDPSLFLQSGISIAQKVWGKATFLDPTSWGMLIAGFILLACFGLMAARIIQILCEFYIVMNAGIILLGFGGMGFFKDYSVNFIKYSFSVAVKLFSLQVLVGLCFSFVDDIYAIPATLQGAAIMIGVSLVMVVLTNTIPDIIGGVLQGSNVSTGNALAQNAMAAMAAGYAAAKATASGAETTGGIASGAVKAAKADGHTGSALAREAAKNVARSIAKAVGSRPMDDRSFGDRVRSDLSARTQDALLKKEGGE